MIRYIWIQRAASYTLVYKPIDRYNVLENLDVELKGNPVY